MFVMWNSDDKAKVKSKKVKVGTLRVLLRGLPLSLASRVVLLFCLFTFAFFLSACRRDMQDQPKVIAYRQNPFYRDGVSAKPPVEGTVPRGYLRADREYYLGKKANIGQQSSPVSTQPAGSQASAAPGSSTSSTALYPDDVETFPFPITKDDLNRGQERYQIFCSVCHGATGNGDGMIARRGFNKPAPASYHQDRLRQAPVGHFFDVMTNGWGAMPSYATQIPVEDRWKIIAYIRALQLSQMPPAQAAQAPSTKPGGPDVRAPGGKK
jgi:mono/diheme cytochrome c family protein